MDIDDVLLSTDIGGGASHLEFDLNGDGLVDMEFEAAGGGQAVPSSTSEAFGFGIEVVALGSVIGSALLGEHLFLPINMSE